MPIRDGTGIGSNGTRPASRSGVNLSTLVAVVGCAVIPAVVVATMLVVAVRHGPIAFDFQNELYPLADALLRGDDPYPGAIWPPLAAAVAMPFTVLSTDAANFAFAVAGLVCFVAALRVVGVRDWRVYGIAALWPSVVGEVRLSHLTPLLCLLLACVWRFRDRSALSGVALGVATGVKFLVWPVAVWMLARRRFGAAAVAVVVALGSLLLLLPYVGPGDYARTLSDVSDAYDQDGYSLYGLAVRLDAPEGAARALTILVGATLLALTWRRRSFALSIAAALVLSPIVWLDYFALAAIPLAVARPSLSLVWFAPLLTWGLPSSGIAAREVSGVGRVLVVFAVVLLVATRHEPREGSAA
jgi:hypothetical protein